MNNFNNFLSHLNSFGSHKKPYMGGNYKNKKSFKRIDDITPTPADNNQAPTATPVVTGYNYPETMVGSLDNMNDSLPSMAASTQPMSSTPLPVKRQAPTATPPATNLMRTVVPAKALPTATGTALQMGQQAAEIKGADAWGKSRAGTFDYANETLPSANYDPVVTQGREALEASKKFREDNDARDAVRTTDRNKVRDAKQAEAKRMRNSSEQWERDLQAKLDEKEQQRQAGPEHQARLAEIERMNAELPSNPNNSSAGDPRPRDTMGNLLEANNITNFADHMKFLSFHSGRLNEQDGPIEPPPTETPPFRYYYQDRTPKAPTATPPNIFIHDQDGPIEPPRTEEPEPFVGPPSPQSNKPSISPSPRSRRDNWNEDPYFKDAETVQGVNDANGVVAPTGKPNTTHFMKSMPFYPAKEKKSSPYKNGQFIDPIKDTKLKFPEYDSNQDRYEEEFKEAPRDAMGNLLEANNITNFADHMKFLSFHSGRLNEEDTSYDDVESSRIRAMDQNTTSLPQDDETVQNLDKAWDYRNSWLAKGKIKDAWSKMSPREQQQARNYAKSKGRDFSEMNSALNETSNHNILLNYLNSFSNNIQEARKLTRYEQGAIQRAKAKKEKAMRELDKTLDALPSRMPQKLRVISPGTEIGPSSRLLRAGESATETPPIQPVPTPTQYPQSTFANAEASRQRFPSLGTNPRDINGDFMVTPGEMRYKSWIRQGV